MQTFLTMFVLLSDIFFFHSDLKNNVYTWKIKYEKGDASLSEENISMSFLWLILCLIKVTKNIPVKVKNKISM